MFSALSEDTESLEALGMILIFQGVQFDKNWMPHRWEKEWKVEAIATHGKDQNDLDFSNFI